MYLMQNTNKEREKEIAADNEIINEEAVIDRIKEMMDLEEEPE